jgi:hypothetical protein
MGIFYGDIHYGLKVSKKIIEDESTFLETIFELKFDDRTISLNDYLEKIRNLYFNMSNPEKYQFELLVDIIFTHDQIKSYKGWQIITIEQMNNCLNYIYKIDYL